MLGVGGPDYTLEAEIKDGLFHKRGALATGRADRPVDDIEMRMTVIE